MVEKLKESWLSKIEKWHPFQTMVYLAMVGSGSLFLFLTLSFLITGLTQPQPLVLENFSVPNFFIASSIILTVSGYLASQITYHYKQDQIHKLKQAIAVTFLSGLAFTLLQFLGWGELRAMGVNFQGVPSGSFLYVLSGIHVFHLFGALTYALILLVQVHQSEKDEVKLLWLLANPFEKMKFKLFVIYWIFMDVVWLLLFLTFLVAF